MGQHAAVDAQIVDECQFAQKHGDVLFLLWWKVISFEALQQLIYIIV